MKQPILCLLAIIFFALKISAQKQEKFTIEDVKQLCKGMPLDKKARMSVTRFSVTTSTPDQQQQSATQQNAGSNNLLKLFHGNNAPRADAIPPTLGDNMTAMLTDALQNTNCFRVLESLLHKDDLNSEIDYGDSKYSSKKGPKAGKQLGPQISVTGEVTEFSNKENSTSILGISGSKKTMKLGFIIKMINSETRDVIISHQFRIQSKAGGSVSVLFFNGGSNSDPATAAVLQDGVFAAVQYLSHIRDSLNIDVNNIPGSASRDPNAFADVDVSLANATFASYTNLTKIIAGIPGYQSMEKSFTGGVGSYTVSFKGGGSKLLDEMMSKLGTQFEVVGADADKIEIKAR